MRELRNIKEESFQLFIEAWQRRREKGIRLEGDYYEGETMWFVVWDLNKLFVALVLLLF